MENQSIELELYDGWTPDPRRVSVCIERIKGSIYIRPENTGDKTSMDGEGWPILLEYYQGSLRLVVWSDINNEEPTHNICLDGALNSKRKIVEADTSK
jgi:hypothetical protein